MIDGTYAVSAKTPFGAKNGHITLATDGTACTGDLTIGEKGKRLEGVVNDGTVTFEGSVHLPFPFGNVAFTIEGTVEGDVLVGACRTKKFKFDIEGTRVSES